jgi:hypothetical protein
MRLNHILFIAVMLCLGNLGYTQNKKITISCNVSNPIERQVTFIVSKGIFRPIEIDSSLALSSNNTVKFIYEVTGTTRVKVYHDYRYFEVYCEPNDSIHLKFDAEIYPTSIEFSGRDTVATQNPCSIGLRFS